MRMKQFRATGAKDTAQEEVQRTDFCNIRVWVKTVILTTKYCVQGY